MRPIILTVWLAIAAIVAAPASAAPGDLFFGGCVSSLSGACTQIGSNALEGARDVATTPDGKSVYVASEVGSISHFRRDASGNLFFGGCIASGGVSGCTNVGSAALTGARGVAISPDGTSVYVTSVTADSVSHFRRDASGDLFFGGCVASGGATGCTDVGSAALDGAFGVDVSPDGSSVYATSFLADSVSHFRRDASGNLFFGGCIANAGANGCTNPGSAPLDSAQGVEVAPNGKSVYVASVDGNSISHFSRDGEGRLFFGGCIASGGANGCTNPGTNALSGAAGVAVSPDGAGVYVASHIGDSISHFRTDADGRLFFGGCIASLGANGCTSVPNVLNRSSAVAISPDGRSVYVASPDQGLADDGSVTHFRRDPTSGSLTFGGCLADQGANGCTNVGSRILYGARGVAVSPAGNSVYVSGFSARSVSHFRRELAGDPGGGGGPGGGPGGGGAVPRCAGKRVTLIGTARRDVLRGTRRNDVILALGGNDVVKAGRGNDVVCAGSGSDRVAGESGKDRLSGEGGRDRLSGGSGNDVVSGGSGVDRLLGQAGRDRLVGGPGRDRIAGGPGVDRQRQ